MMRLISDMFLGLRSLFSAIKIILTHPSVLILSCVVGFVALLLSGFGIYASIEFGPEITKWFWELSGLQGLESSVDRSDFWGEVAYQSLYWTREILEWASMLIGILAALVLLPWLVVLLGFPLCIPLSERTDAILGGKPAEHGLLTAIRLSVISIFLTTVIGIAVQLLLYLLAFVPIIGPIFAFVGTFVWPQLVYAYMVYENSLDRRGLNFREKVAFVRSRLIGSWGVGAQTQLLIAIPILNLVGLPLAVVAGAVAVRKIEDSTDTKPLSTEPVIDVEVVSPALPSTDSSADAVDAAPTAIAEAEEVVVIDEQQTHAEPQDSPVETNTEVLDQESEEHALSLDVDTEAAENKS